MKRITDLETLLKDMPGGAEVLWEEQSIQSKTYECNGEAMHESWSDDEHPLDAVFRLYRRVKAAEDDGSISPNARGVTTPYEVFLALIGRAGYGIALIAEERARQVEVEGYTPEQDCEYYANVGMRADLARAAIAYAANKLWTEEHEQLLKMGFPFDEIWPWDAGDKREKHDRKRSLVIAGSLIVAELDRMIAEGDDESEVNE